MSGGGGGRMPDFFIVGAPRCGTTFMYEYLRCHPQIFMPERKEPEFFCSDLDSGNYMDSLSFMRSEEEYRALFRPARPDQRVGEASTWYLYSTVAARRIREASPDAIIIAMLRDPVEMIYSLHGRRVFSRSEDLTRFSDALDAEEDRQQGRRIPPRARNVKALFYRQIARYPEQVQRYFDIFGPDRVKVIIFEDFRRDPAASYRSTLEFLGVDPEFQPDFQVVNAARTRRSDRLQSALLSPTLIRVARRVIPAVVRPRVGPLWDLINSREEKRPPLDPALSARLHEELRPQIAQMGRMLGRDLTEVWR